MEEELWGEKVREVLFRGKNKRLNRWVEGAYLKHIKRTPCVIGDSVEDDDIQHVILKDEFSDWNMPRGIEAVEVDPDSVGEWTGLVDVVGRKIFEGDILDLCDEWGVWVVEWWDVAARFRLVNRADSTMIVFSTRERNKMEVIGNIYDNPEFVS